MAIINDSNNHLMLGHLMEWFYSGLAVIRPGKETSHITESNQPLNEQYGVTKIKYENGYQLVSIGSGKYCFMIK